MDYFGQLIPYSRDGFRTHPLELLSRDQIGNMVEHQHEYSGQQYQKINEAVFLCIQDYFLISIARGGLVPEQIQVEKGW